MTSDGEQDPMLGQRFGQGSMLIQKKLGEGGMGAVYLASDEKHSRSVAVKFLRSPNTNRDTVERFKKEGQQFGALRHENLVRVYGFGREHGHIYIVSEFLDGKNIYQILHEKGPFEVEEALRIARDIAAGLHEAHKAHIVHRDLKPENVIVRNADGVVKVLDFGIAKDLGASIAQTRFGHYIGTPAYSAPEQIKGSSIDHRADIFSLGVILYEMLTGKVAFQGRETSDILKATMSNAPIPPGELNDNVTKPVVQLINKMIQKSPRMRPRDMYEVMQEIDRVRAALAKGYTEEEKGGIKGWLRSFFQGGSEARPAEG